MSLFTAVEMAPRDPILGLNEQFAADTNPNKVNLGVGVYYDDNGKLPLLECVKKAEADMMQAPSARGYLPKTAKAAEVVAAVRTVHAGGSALDPAVGAKVIQEYRRLAAASGPQEGLAGLKEAELDILRLLADRGAAVTVVPAETPAKDVLALKPDGVFLSNGPGDPEPCDYAVAAIRDLVSRRVPVFGICLGHQLLGLAAGARTLKMKFGHHGANHPVLDLDTGHVMISSQNHGFAVDEATLPPNVRATHRSLFDGSLQGLAYTDAPVYGFQGHPEASPGPHDVQSLFDRFYAAMAEKREAA